MLDRSARHDTSPLAAQAVNVTTTFLEIPSRPHFHPVFVDRPGLLVLQAHNPIPPFYRFLYGTVGRDYHWVDRLAWSDDRLATYLARPTTTLLVLYEHGTPAGYVELNTAAEEPGTEVAYLGVQRAFDDGACRVWVHTCTLDGQYALANYKARGFIPYHSEIHQQTLHMSYAA
jgi:hypothetical protein